MNKHDKKYVIDTAPYTATELKEHEVMHIISNIKKEHQKNELKRMATVFITVVLTCVLIFLFVIFPFGGW